MIRQSRRHFLQSMGGLGLAAAGLGALAGCRGVGGQVAPILGEPSPEIRKIRLFRSPSLCAAPQFLAQSLLQSEGFSEVEYVQANATLAGSLTSGAVDMLMGFSAPTVIRVDAGDPLVMLGGIHVGCFELFGTDQVRTVRDLKGKTVGINGIDGVQHVFVSSMAAYVGLDPRTDITFAISPPAESVRRLTEGSIDAFLGFPPEPQDLRARKIGRVVLNSAVEKPWSQYFCCMVTASKTFVQKNPVATKRALRAFLKAADLCAADPDGAAQYLVDNSFAPRLDYARQTLHEIPYASWREYDPEDAIRFYSLRLQEIGMIKSAPDRIIQNGTDWRFLNELKQELKA